LYLEIINQASISLQTCDKDSKFDIELTIKR